MGNRIVLLGGGGHASDLLGVIEVVNSNDEIGDRIEVVGVLDDTNPSPRRFEGRSCPLLGTIDGLQALDRGIRHVLAVGFPAGKEAIAERIAGWGRQPAPPVVHPTASLGRNVYIGDGTFILAGAHISPLAHFGRHVYISHGALIGHDAHLGDFTSVMPGAAISGDTSIGVGVMIGTNSTVLQGVTIGDRAVIGAGAVVLKDVPGGTTVVGNPARPR